MFRKPINEITFEDVESFCKEWSEGVRVEYKQEIAHIPKIVSSFANTQGGIFIIGVKADQEKNEVIFPIQGIPPKSGIEEQIQQSALTGIYPAIMPEVKIVDVPDTENVVVVLRIDESVQAPHAIQNSTKTYIRVGNITQPYELADMDRIKYMFKRREDAQEVTKQILNRIEERTHHLNCAQGVPSITVIAKPVFPYRPVISARDIYKLCEEAGLFPLRSVTGGVSSIHPKEYYEFNEYGVVYHRIVLPIYSQQEINYSAFILYLSSLIDKSKTLYKKCEYMGNIEISAHLQGVLDKELGDPGGHAYGESKITDGSFPEGPKCSDSEVFVSTQCLARDLENEKRKNDIVEELTCELLWAFNIRVNKLWIRERISRRVNHGPL